jgi:hypothetical protein
VASTGHRAPARGSHFAPTRTARPYGSTVPPGAAARFSALESGIAGSVGLAVAPRDAGRITPFGSLQAAHAWSTNKVPVIATLLRDDEHDGQELNPDERSSAALALEQSDNAPIEALFADLKRIRGGLVSASAAVQTTLRTTGDETTTINTAPNDEGLTTYGQTDWPVSNEVQFYRALANGCLLNPQDTAYVLSLMRNAISYERWDAGSAGYPTNVPLAFKGGWELGTRGRYQVRQTAIIGSGNDGYVVSMLAIPTSGSFTDGTNMASSLATWAREHFDLDAIRAPHQCATAP